MADQSISFDLLFASLDEDDLSHVERDACDLILPKLSSHPNITPVVQHGIRTGQRLLDHLVQGVGFLLDLTKWLNLPPDDARLLVAAFVLHDLNKLDGERRSLSRTVRDTDHFTRVCAELAIDAFLGGPDAFQSLTPALRFLIENTSHEHAKLGDAFLGDASALPIDAHRLAERLRPLMTAADVRDLPPDDHTPDSLDALRMKDRVCALIAHATGRRVLLLHHRVAEHIGALSQLIHRAAEDSFRAAGALPLWIYPEGTAYIAFEDAFNPSAITPDAITHRFFSARLNLMLPPDDALLLKQFSPGKDGLKIPERLVAALDPDRISSLVDLWSSQSNLTAVRKNLLERRAKLNRSRDVDPSSPDMPHDLRWLIEDDDSLRAGNIYRAAENIFKTFNSGPASTALLLSYIQDPRFTDQSLSPTLYDAVYERPYLIGGNLSGGIPQALSLITFAAQTYRATLPPSIREGFSPALSSYIQEVLTLSPSHANTLPPALDYLRQYIKDSPNRSAFGAARTKTSPLMGSDIGKSFGKVSQFANTQKPGSSDPKRFADEITQNALALQSLINESGIAVPHYIHLSPRLGSSPHEWRDVAQQFTNLRARLVTSDGNRLFLIGTHWNTKKVGFVLPERPLQHANTLTLPFYAPAESDTERFLSAATHAAILALETRTIATVSDVPQHILTPSPSTRLLLCGCPLSLHGLFPHLSYDAPQLALLVQRLHTFRTLERTIVKKQQDSALIALAASLRRGWAPTLYLCDKLLTRKHGDDPLITSDAFRAWTHTLSLFEDSMTTQPLMSYIETLTEIASTHGLTPSGFDRNKLLRPLNEFFKQVRRQQAPLDADAIIAASEDRIFTAIETINKREGDSTGGRQREGARLFAAKLRDLLHNCYNDDLNRLRSQERILKSCYITSLRHRIHSLSQAKKAKAAAEAAITTASN